MNPIKQRVHQPHQFVQKKWSYRIKEMFLRFFGDLKLFEGQPRFFVFTHLISTLLFKKTFLYDPKSYRVNGLDMRRAMQDLKAGDILIRGFNNYVDGKFIPGFFSHVGLYLGAVDEKTIRKHWSSSYPGTENTNKSYAPLEEVLTSAVMGEQMVIHSMKDGVFMEDLLNFCRCDYLVAVRFSPNVIKNQAFGELYSERQEIKKVFTSEETIISDLLKNGKQVSFEEIFPVIFKLALTQLGKEYDFSLDFTSFKKMSCTEFVYYCTKSLECISGVQPVVENVVGIRAPGISPDGFVGPSQLEVSFASQSVVDLGVIQKIKEKFPGPYGE